MPALRALLSLATLAVLALSSAPVYVNALVADRAEVARHVHAHDVVARRKRSDPNPSGGHCKPRPTSGSPTPTPPPASPPTSTPSSTPTSSTPSSSAPAPTPTSPSNGGGKKWGLAGTDENVLANFAYLPKVGFYYNWSVYPPSNLYGLEYIPMLWGWRNVGDFQSKVVAGFAKYALGMNEPNEPSQSNIDPQTGANMWRQYIDPLKDQGYYLISPACTDDDAGLAWYQQFFAACQGCRIDAIAFHAYTTDASFFIQYANTLHTTYNLPVWVTEFADQNFSGVGGQPDMNQMWDFAGQVTSFIDGTSWMEGAFPFGALDSLEGVADVNNLQGSNGLPTDLGYYYFG